MIDWLRHAAADRAAGPVVDLGDVGRDAVFGWGLPQVPVTCL